MRPTYDNIGAGYDGGRRADARILRRLHRSMGNAAKVLDVGTGTGNYSPVDRFCVGVDPSSRMLNARRRRGRQLSVQAVAEALPFASKSFDCAIGVLTAHHWTDLGTGLEEMSRTSARQVLFIREPFRTAADFWLLEYFPAILEIEAAGTYPTAAEIGRSLHVTNVEEVAVPADCADGFLGCYWNRPEAFLEPEIRRCISVFSFMAPEVEALGVERLRYDLFSGRWDAHHGSLRSQEEYSVGHRLVAAA